MKDFLVTVLSIPMLIYTGIPIGIIYFFRWLCRLYHEGHCKAVIVALIFASIAVVQVLDDLWLIADAFSHWLGVGVMLGRCLMATVILFAFVPALDSINNPDEDEPAAM